MTQHPSTNYNKFFILEYAHCTPNHDKPPLCCMQNTENEDTITLFINQFLLWITTFYQPSTLSWQLWYQYQPAGRYLVVLLVLLGSLASSDLGLMHGRDTHRRQRKLIEGRFFFRGSSDGGAKWFPMLPSFFIFRAQRSGLGGVRYGTLCSEKWFRRLCTYCSYVCPRFRVPVQMTTASTEALILTTQGQARCL
jgi:hypothetical protein